MAANSGLKEPKIFSNSTRENRKVNKKQSRQIQTKYVHLIMSYGCRMRVGLPRIKVSECWGVGINMVILRKYGFPLSKKLNYCSVMSCILLMRVIVLLCIDF